MALPYIRKINRHHLSVFEYMAVREVFAEAGYKNPPRLFTKLSRFFYPNKNHPFSSRIHDGKEHIGKIFLGTLQPFVEMAKDVADTFKPYKTIWPHAIKDFLQPLRGVGNILKALATIAALPLFLVIGTIDAFFPFKYDKEYNGENLDHPLSKRVLYNFQAILSWVPHAITTIIRGITQIAFTPFAWVKVLIRAGITKKYGRQKIQDDRGVRQLMEEIKNADSVEIYKKNRPYEDDEVLERYIDSSGKQTNKPFEHVIDPDGYRQSIDEELERKCIRAYKQKRVLSSELVTLLHKSHEEWKRKAKQNTGVFQPEIDSTTETAPPPKPETDYRFITFFRTAIAERSGPKVVADLESQSDSSQAQEDDPLLGNRR